MATLAQLYTRIILDTNRDDMGSGGELEQAKIDAVADAIDTYDSEQFWFNRASGTGSTTAADATLTMPSGVKYPKVVSYNGEALTKVQLDEIEHRTETGLPTKWAENEGQIQLWPIPDAAYEMGVFGLSSTGVPASGGDSNIWTTEGYKLILNEAKMTLCLGPLADDAGATRAERLRNDALSALRRETRLRGCTTLSTELGATGSYNINTDQ